jgi:prepilin-type processing-associated H-X9-DG protein
MDGRRHLVPRGARIPEDRMGRASRGITLIELLAMLAIIGIAVALLLPALMSAREGARRAQCASNLKQIGLAVHAYIATYDALPPAGSDTDHLESWQTPVDHSMKARLLGFLDQQALFDAINFSQPINPYAGPDAPYFANVTVTATSLALFLCPSDAGADVSEAFAGVDGVEFEAAATNYPNNLGVTPTYTNNILNGPAYILGSPDRSLPLVRIGTVLDGASQTAMFSEYVLGDAREAHSGNSGDLLRASFSIPWTTRTGTSRGDSRACQESGLLRGHYKGEFWVHHDPGRGGGYFHTNPPDTKSCNGGWFPYGWVTASSFHPGGVNVLLLDGSVRFVSRGINYPAWLALGTMAGGEVRGDAW